MNAYPSAGLHGNPAPDRASWEQDEAARVLLRTLTRALAAVAALALAFTAVNVTQLAVRHDVPWPTALLLDLALATCLTVDARLAELGAAPPGWAVALRWFAGLTAWALNVWESVWPASAGGVGVPRDADPTGIVLHSTPCALLVLVSEAVAAYRSRIRGLLRTPLTWPPATPQGPDVPVAPGVYPAYPTSSGTRGTPGYTAPAVPVGAYPPAPDAPAPSETATAPDPDGDPLYRAALDLDREARAATGRPVTIRALRTELRVGQARARALRDRLDDDPADRDGGLAAPAPNTPGNRAT